MAKKGKVSKNTSKTVEKPSSNNSKEKFNFDMNLLKKAIPVVLIIFVMWFAFFVRSGPIYLDGMSQNVEANTLNQIKNIISQQIDQQYPNLNDAYKQELVNKEYQKVLDSGKINLGGQELILEDIVEQNSKGIVDAFKAENGQTYLNAIDPYYFLRISENVLETETTGDEMRDGVAFDSKKLAPLGRESPEMDFHTWIENVFFKLNSVTSDSSIGEKTGAIYLIPVIFVMLAVIPIFMIIRKFSNDLFALFGSILLVSIGTFVSRTIAGFVDTDAYNVFFPLMIAAFLIYGFLYENKWLTIGFAAIAGLFQGLFIWAWASGWFIFVFAVSTLLSYIGYLVIKNLINRVPLKKLSTDSINDGLTLASFIISSYLFTFLFAGKDLITTILGGVNRAVTGIATISQTNIWPNVFSSVAELNPASFNQIIGSVGGKIVFIIAMLGLVMLALDYKSKNNKFNLYNKILLLASTIWFISIVNAGLFVNLTANLPLVFIALLFLPIGVGIIMSLFNETNNSKVFLAILLSIWMAGTIYMSLNGTRFILLLGPAFAIAFAMGLFYFSRIINDFMTKEFDIKHHHKKLIPGFISMSILFLILFVPMANQATAISKGTTPNFDDAWYGSMEKIKTNSSEDAIITSWWDFGHFFAAVADRGVTFDGGSQTTPRAHWVGKLLMENDEDKAHDILRMLVCGGNEAHNTMLSYTDGTAADAIKINKIIYETFGKDINQTREIISNNKYYSFTDSQTKEIMNYLACEQPRENFLITSEDMVGKAGVWAHWGSWDFTKKYVHDNYKKLSAEQIAEDIDENTTLINQYIDELENIDVRADQENIKRNDLVNRWFADYPSYVPLQNRYQYPCQSQNTTLTCQNGLKVDMLTGQIENPYNSQLSIGRLIYPTAQQTLMEVPQENGGNVDAILIPSQDGFNIMLAQSPLGNSLFTKLFYLNGFGTKYFEKFDDVQSVTGVRVITWKTQWDINETEENIINLDDLQVEEVETNETISINSSN